MRAGGIKRLEFDGAEAIWQMHRQIATSKTTTIRIAASGTRAPIKINAPPRTSTTTGILSGEAFGWLATSKKGRGAPRNVSMERVCRCGDGAFISMDALCGHRWPCARALLDPLGGEFDNVHGLRLLSSQLRKAD
jgi:hypothetical protein